MFDDLGIPNWNWFLFRSHHIPVRLESSSKAKPETLQYVSWLGDTNSLLMVYNNDIYLRQSPSDETDTRLTFSGRPEVIYNGIPDWLYQGMTNSRSHLKRIWTSRVKTSQLLDSALLDAALPKNQSYLLTFRLLWFAEVPFVILQRTCWKALRRCGARTTALTCCMQRSMTAK